MVASCYRKSGNYAAALDKYKSIHFKFPDNTECLKFLVRICTDLGYTQEAQEYANLLKKAEKMKEVQQAVCFYYLLLTRQSLRFDCHFINLKSIFSENIKQREA